MMTSVSRDGTRREREAAAAERTSVARAVGRALVVVGGAARAIAIVIEHVIDPPALLTNDQRRHYTRVRRTVARDDQRLAARGQR